MILKQAARDALTVQDACNLSGVVHSWARAMTAIPAMSTAERNQHPIAQLFAYKAAALAGMEPLDWGLSEEWTRAEAACRRIAEEEE